MAFKKVLQTTHKGIRPYSTRKKYDAVVCGAGLIGVATAYNLSCKHGLKVALVDERPPMSLTSARSTETFYSTDTPNSMEGQFLERARKLVQPFADVSGLEQRGVLLVAPSEHDFPELVDDARVAAGDFDVRFHRGLEETQLNYAPTLTSEEAATGVDILQNQEALMELYPFLSPSIAGAAHLRQGGWLNVGKLGSAWLNEAEAKGTTVVRGKVTGFSKTTKGAVSGVKFVNDGGEQELKTSQAVIASGPMLRNTLSMLGEDLPVFVIPQGRLEFEDSFGILPRAMPILRCNAPLSMFIETEERHMVPEGKEWLLNPQEGPITLRVKGDANLCTVLWEQSTPMME